MDVYGHIWSYMLPYMFIYVIADLWYVVLRFACMHLRIRCLAEHGLGLRDAILAHSTNAAFVPMLPRIAHYVCTLKSRRTSKYTKLDIYENTAILAIYRSYIGHIWAIHKLYISRVQPTVQATDGP